MFCTKCGAEIGDESKFCSACGLAIGGSVISTPPSDKIETISDIPRIKIKTIIWWLVIIAFIVFVAPTLIGIGAVYWASLQ